MKISLMKTKSLNIKNKKTKCLFKDKAGNKLYIKYIKTRKTPQLFAKNKKGALVDETGVKTLYKKYVKNK